MQSVRSKIFEVVTNLNEYFGGEVIKRLIHAVNESRSDILFRRAIAWRHLRKWIAFSAVIALAVTLALLIWWGLDSDLNKSEWASWVQAVGSIFAIVIAAGAVIYQRNSDSLAQDELARQANRKQVIVYKTLLLSIAERCNQIAKMVGSKHAAWELQAEVLQEQRNALKALPVTALPDQALVLGGHNSLHLLHMCSSMVESLSLPRSQQTQDKVRDFLNFSQRELLVQFTQATEYYARISTFEEIADDKKLLDQESANRKILSAVTIDLKNEGS